MNGRIYDPLLGRFLSADLLVENPANLQAYNRYTYVRNNPLTLVDPTGWYSILGLEFTDGGGVGGFFKDLAGYGGDVAMGAVGDNLVAGYKSGEAHMEAGMTEIANAHGALDVTIGTLHMVAGVGDAVSTVLSVTPGGKAEGAALKGAEKLAVTADRAASKAVNEAEGIAAAKLEGKTATRIEGVETKLDSKITKEAPAVEAKAGKPKGGTYKLKDADGKVRRTGRSKDLARREAEHARGKETKDLKFEVDRRTDNYAEQRGREEKIYDQHPEAKAENGGLNKQKPISDKNPRKKEYGDAADAME